jgi:flagellin
MSLRINTNVSSLAVQRALNLNQRANERTTLNVATGSRLANPSSDVAGTAIAEQLNSDVVSLSAAKRNASGAQDISALAEGSMSEQSNILTRMRELAVQSASDVYSDSERTMMEKEFTQIRDEADRIARTTKFGDRNLLNGSNNKFDFQVGKTGGEESRITLDTDTDTTASGLSIDGSSVSSKSDARSAIEDIDKGLQTLGLQRASFGATQARLESAENSIGASVENLSRAHSQIADADLAKEISDLRRTQVLQQYQAAMLQQVNDQPSLALRLIA